MRKIKINKKGALEFGWIFSIIIGAIILFFAFYFVYSQVMQQQLFEQKVQTQGIDVLLTPFSYLGSIGSASAKIADLDRESRISVSCTSPDSSDALGYNRLVTQSIYKGETVPGGLKNAYDKYIFADEMQSKKLFVLSKPFEAPWRIGDLIYFFPNNRTYYFSNAPTRIKEELEIIEANFDNKHFFFTIANIPENSIKVCFRQESNCNITVYNEGENYELGRVTKKNSKNEIETIYYYNDALMYAAIFSNKELYECNVQRLFSRALIQLDLYQQKNTLIIQKGCVANINLQSLAQSFEKLKTFPNNLDNFKSLKTQAIFVNNANKNAIYCGLY